MEGEMRRSVAPWATEPTASDLPAETPRRPEGHTPRTQDLETADAVGAYFQQIGAVKLLNAAEEIALAERIAMGKRAARQLEQPCTDVDIRGGLLCQIASGEDARQRLGEANLRLRAAIAALYPRPGLHPRAPTPQGRLG